MGRDKALLPWGTSTLLDHAVERVRAAVGSATILSGTRARYEDRGPVLRDRHGAVGPLAGVHAGLGACRDAGLFLAVDLPCVPVALLRHLASLAGDADVVVPHTSRGPEPLCAVYSRRCREPIERCIAAGLLQMTAFWGEVTVREIGEDQLARYGEPRALFANVNAPDDYAALAAAVRER